MASSSRPCVTAINSSPPSRPTNCSAGMDAINTYIPKGKTPEDLVRWSRAQVGGGPLREDLALSNAEELNESVEDLERWGPSQKDIRTKSAMQFLMRFWMRAWQRIQ